jgi:histidine phosphotransferase ChpT
LAKNRVKLLLNLLILAGQTIPRGGTLTVAALGEGDAMGFQITAAGLNARIPQAVPALLTADGAAQVDAHAIQPFFTGMLARSCGLTVTLAPDGEAIVIAAGPAGG